MRSVRLARSSSVLVAKIHQIVAPSDDKARFFIGWWLRMHREPGPIIAVDLKLIEWSDGEIAPQRFVWEVCRWPQGRSSGWSFVCWMIDGTGMWMKRFPSKRAAIAYFRQSPDVVMANSIETDQTSNPEEPLAAVS